MEQKHGGYFSTQSKRFQQLTVMYIDLVYPLPHPLLPSLPCSSSASTSPIVSP